MAKATSSCSFCKVDTISRHERELQGRRMFSIGPAGYGGGSRNLRAGGGHPSCPARGYGGAL